MRLCLLSCLLFKLCLLFKSHTIRRETIHFFTNYKIKIIQITRSFSMGDTHSQTDRYRYREREIERGGESKYNIVECGNYDSVMREYIMLCACLPSLLYIYILIKKV